MVLSFTVPTEFKSVKNSRIPQSLDSTELWILQTSGDWPMRKTKRLATDREFRASNRVRIESFVLENYAELR